MSELRISLPSCDEKLMRRIVCRTTALDNRDKHLTGAQQLDRMSYLDLLEVGCLLRLGGWHLADERQRFHWEWLFYTLCLRVTEKERQT